MAAAPSHAPIAVLGAGPAGLTAAHVLASRGRAGIVFEADSQVGGIAKTVEHDGFRFDLGGHRFFTKVPVGAGDVGARRSATSSSLRPRLSRIYYRGSLLRLSAARRGRRPPSRPRRDRCAASARTPRRRCGARSRRETFEDWVTAPLRPPALRRVLPRVHREGVGHPRHRDPGRVGGAADPEPLVLDGADLGAAAQAAPRDEPDRGVPLPAARARADVGDAGRRRSRQHGVPVRLGHRVTRVVHDGRAYGRSRSSARRRRRR